MGVVDPHDECNYNIPIVPYMRPDPTAAAIAQAATAATATAAGASAITTTAPTGARPRTTTSAQAPTTGPPAVSRIPVYDTANTRHNIVITISWTTENGTSTPTSASATINLQPSNGPHNSTNGST